MNQLLKNGMTVKSESSGLPCTVKRFLGGGTQGEVYEATLEGKPMALKWYFPNYLRKDQNLRKRIDYLIKIGPPDDNFSWPIDIMISDGVPAFGYIMPLREGRFKSINDWMKRKIEPTFHTLCTTGFNIVDGFKKLHAKGLSYRDISFGNIFFDPQNGDVLICDNDNVSVDKIGSTGVLGTPSFMAPEIVLGKAMPSRDTDLFSLAIFLFYLFVVHHPLEGEKEYNIHCFDLPAREKLYGEDATFIFDPNDDSNKPVPKAQQNALLRWPLLPKFLQDLFIKSFTRGIDDPQNGRVQESEWMAAMVKLRNSIFYCANCKSENFYDKYKLNQNQGSPGECWNCHEELILPARMKLIKGSQKEIVMLNYDTKLFLHHTDRSRTYDFSKPVAELSQHPKDPQIWGLKNLSQNKWISTQKDGTNSEIAPNKTIRLMKGLKINFGTVEGIIAT